MKGYSYFYIRLKLSEAINVLNRLIIFFHYFGAILLVAPLNLEYCILFSKEFVFVGIRLKVMGLQ